MVNRGEIYEYELKKGISSYLEAGKRKFLIIDSYGDSQIKAVAIAQHFSYEMNKDGVDFRIDEHTGSVPDRVLTDCIFLLPVGDLKERISTVDEQLLEIVEKEASNALIVDDASYNDNDNNCFYLHGLKLQNFRKYSEAAFSFRKGINLLIGNNGAGKTSALAALSVALSDFVYCLSNKFQVSIEMEDVHSISKKIGETTYEFEYKYPVKVKTFFNLNEDDYYFQHEVNASISYNKPSIILPLSKEGFLQKSSVFPLISYQRFDRDWNLPMKRNSTEVSISTGAVDRLDGYKNCLSGVDHADQIQKWCLKMSMIEFERRGEVKEFRTFQKIIDRFMKAMESEESEYLIKYSTDVSGLVYDNGHEQLPLYSLSTGYKALLSMVMELAYRAVVLNPTIDSDLNELRGIVLIDELDAHLHPQWQWKVLGALETVFPNVQFIIATHSPMVISSAKNVNIIALDNGEINYVEGAYGYSVDDVLLFRQSSTNQPEVSRKYSEALDEAIDKENLVEAGNIIKKAKDEFGEESAFYKELYQYYSMYGSEENQG